MEIQTGAKGSGMGRISGCAGGPGEVTPELDGMGEGREWRGGMAGIRGRCQGVSGSAVGWPSHPAKLPAVWLATGRRRRAACPALGVEVNVDTDVNADADADADADLDVISW
jgi:hypothetical protein